MNTYTFKTSINCNGCLSRIKPILDDVTGIVSWKMNLEHPDKILTVVCENLQTSVIIDIIDNAGFEIELIESKIN